MFRSMGSSVPASLRGQGLSFGTTNRQAAFRGRAATVVYREVSGFAPTERTMAFRSWKGPHMHHYRLETLSFSRWTASINKRAFFSDPYLSPHELNQTSRFTPLEDFLLDAMAWMVAFSLWYIPNNVEFDDDDRLEDGDNCDAQLEYREDYGPTVSHWPSKSPSSGRKENGNSKNPKAKE